MNKRPNHISILLVPDNNGKTFQIRLRTTTIKIIAGFLIAGCLLVGIGFFSYYKVAVMALSTRKILKRNAELEQECQKVNELATILKRAAEADQQIRMIAGGMMNLKTTAGENQGVSTANMEKAVRARVGTELAPRQGLGGQEPPPDLRPLLHSMSYNFVWPIYGGWITNEFMDGTSSEQKHLGIDIAAKIGTPVKVTANGVVSFSGWSSDFGNLLIIDHGNGFLTRYGHNSRVVVEKGDIVKQGKIIAFTGNSGRSSAPHLHFEIWKDGVPVNPRDYLLR
jgi:murein DD-endopeptidase MepM/ murein hydrolase activator NlpD